MPPPALSAPPSPNPRPIDLGMMPAAATLTIAEQIAVQLARDILAGEFAVGQKLSEQALAKRFGVSRGPVRDAIALLERNAFVRSKPRLSARVNETGRYQVQQLFDIRGRVLGLAARYAARNRSTEDLAGLRAAIATMHATHHAHPTDAAVFFLASQGAWGALFRCAHARTIAQLNATITGSAIWQLALNERLHGAGRFLAGPAMLENWDRTAEAIAAGDEQAAEDAACIVIDISWKMIERSFAGADAAPAAAPVPSPRRAAGAR